MKTLLVINASGRATRSITRQMTQRFADGWRRRHGGSKVIHRDVGLEPPPAITESWIAAAFTPAAARTPGMHATLALSEAMIAELFQADAILMGVPMYNFGMPGQLKSYFDQIIRVGRTFNFTGEPENPYQPLIPAKPLVLVTSTGTGGYEPGGHHAHLNFFDGHLKALLEFIGLSTFHPVRVDFEEEKGAQFERSLAAAQNRLDEILNSSAPTADAEAAPQDVVAA